MRSEAARGGGPEDQKAHDTHCSSSRASRAHEMPGSASKTDKIPAVAGRRQLAILSGRETTNEE